MLRKKFICVARPGATHSLYATLTSTFMPPVSIQQVGTFDELRHDVMRAGKRIYYPKRSVRECELCSFFYATIWAPATLEKCDVVSPRHDVDEPLSNNYASYVDRVVFAG